MPEFISQDVLSTSIDSYVDSYGYRIDQLTYNFVSKERPRAPCPSTHTQAGPPL